MKQFLEKDFMTMVSSPSNLRTDSKNFKEFEASGVQLLEVPGNRAEEEIPDHLAVRKTIRRHPYSRSTYGRPREQVKGSLEYAESRSRRWFRVFWDYFFEVSAVVG